MTAHLPGVRSTALASLVLALPLASLTLVAPSAEAAHGGRSRAADSAVTIHAIGDSITYGASSATVPGGYRGTLATVLDKAGVDTTYVGTSTGNPPTGADPLDFLHDGWNGERIDELTAALGGPSDLGGGYWLTGTPTRAPLRADVTVVMAGVNDVYQRYDPANPAAAMAAPYDRAARSTFVKDAARRLRQLVKTVHRLDRRTAIVLCTNVPTADVGADPAYGAEADRQLNREIRGNVFARLQRQGLDIALADVEADFASASERGHGGSLMGDTVHPSAAGYGVLGRSVARAVLSLTDQS